VLDPWCIISQPKTLVNFYFRPDHDSLSERIHSNKLEIAVQLRLEYCVMRRSRWTPSIVPNGSDQNVNLVRDCNARGDCVWREADVGSTDLDTVITDLISGQYPDPLRVVAFNTFEHWALDVSEDVAREVRRRADLSYADLIPGVEEFVTRCAGPERQLTLRLA
jgi:hypothetical protein